MFILPFVRHFNNDDGQLVGTAHPDYDRRSLRRRVVKSHGRDLSQLVGWAKRSVPIRLIQGEAELTRSKAVSVRESMTRFSV
jgi:hypothetical protein